MQTPHDGFGMVELLVVVTLVGVLAVITIPTFLSQRQRASVAAVEADLANAATLMEAGFAANRVYRVEALADHRSSPGVTVALIRDGQAFCLEAQHARRPGSTWAWDSMGGGPQGEGSTC